MCWRECDLAPDATRERTVWHEHAHGYITSPESSLSITSIGINPSASLSTDTMEKLSLTNGFDSETNATRPWRPWTHRSSAHKPYERASADDQHSKASVITHPVKLFWPRSRCFDYLYQDAELLLRSYPVQATICLYEDSDSDDDDDEDSDEEHEKELN